jgi:HAD superfamily hydrolase (TIGR01509 family)
MADRALDAARGDLTAESLAARRAQLKHERAATAVALENLASLRGDSDPFVSLMIPRSQIKPLLGLAPDVVACVFELEGVLIGSATAHAAAWSETFDELIHARVERTHGAFAPFNPRVDYVRYMHGRPRLEGVRAFLASRGIRLPEGTADDPPGAETVHGLANRKKQALLSSIEEHGVTAFAGVRRYLELAREVGVRLAVISASANTGTILRRAGLAGLVDSMVDGDAIAAGGLRSKPAPDILLDACRRLGAEPGRTAVFETSPAGVAAARAAGVELVVGVDRGALAGALRDEGAGAVVPDLANLMRRPRGRLAGSLS